MSNFFEEFKKVSQDDWKAKIVADLKGKPESLLSIDDPVEELHLSSYYHQEDGTSSEIPGAFPYTRGMNHPTNAWSNGAVISVNDEAEANKTALDRLMSGVDLLVFKSEKENINWEGVLNNIGLEHIQTQFEPTSLDEYKKLRELTKHVLTNVQFNLDFLETFPKGSLNELINGFKEQPHFGLMVNGFGIQQCGATTWQEVAFSLSAGHEYLVQLMNAGLSIDDAAACISFRLGVGANYFNAIAKIRSFKRLWANIIRAYKPEHGCTYNARITVFVGHHNKSVKDPYTNLLRQTTEALSALAAGVDAIVILPYNLFSTEKNGELAQRMAINIPLILKEESYLDKVVDPVGGSYSLEQLTDAITDLSWKNFQKLEAANGIFNEEAQSILTAAVEKKREMRIELFNEGKIELIGINKFENPDTVTGEWTEIPGYMGMTALNYELISTNVTA